VTKFHLDNLLKALVHSLLIFAGCATCLAQADNLPAEVTVHPEEIGGALPNPYMGLGLWVGPRYYGMNPQKQNSLQDLTTGFGDDAELFNWVLMDWDWASLEPHEGQFDWQEFDAVAQYWSKRGKQLVVRLWTTDDAGWNGNPGIPVLPQWLWDKGLKSHEYIGNAGRKTLEAAYTDPSFRTVFLPELRKFESEFAKRYDKPGTPVIFLQATGYGQWVDWATWYSKVKFPSMKVKHETLAAVMQTWIDTFHHIPLMEMAATDWDRERYLTLDQLLYAKALDVAEANNFGFIWTGFIDGLSGTYDRVTMQRFWPQHPIFAEGNWSYDEMKDQHTHGTVDENVAGAVDWHANFFHLYFGPDLYKRAMQEDKPALSRALGPGGLGYRLVPSSVSWPAQLPAGHLLVVHQSWLNRNAGRLYIAHPLKLYLTGSDGKEVFSEADKGFGESTWVAGSTYPVMSVFHLPQTIPPGEYDIRIALVDASGKPRIRLGIAGEDEDHRYRLGVIQILPSDAPKSCTAAFCP
jgi:hypothetical protein